MKTILLVEDEQHLHQTIKLNLSLEHYEVTSAFNGKDAFNFIKKEHFDLVILDIMLPEMDGLTLLEHIRIMTKEVPVLLLSAKNEPFDRINGLKKGADDYLGKPFELEELLLRVYNLTHIERPSFYAGKDCVVFGNNKIDFVTNVAFGVDNKKIVLTPKEVMLLKLLIDNEQKLITREKILQVVWGYKIYPNTRTIDNFIMKFRKYFEVNTKEPKHFISVHGLGYKFFY
ncbi:MAG: response regulator transcription factor [Phycisphaerales bacterium]|nr:response regulator transcription factor [Phycisphaerales bacterium]